MILFIENYTPKGNSNPIENHSMTVSLPITTGFSTTNSDEKIWLADQLDRKNYLIVCIYNLKQQVQKLQNQVKISKNPQSPFKLCSTQ